MCFTSSIKCTIERSVTEDAPDIYIYTYSADAPSRCSHSDTVNMRLFGEQSEPLKTILNMQVYRYRCVQACVLLHTSVSSLTPILLQLWDANKTTLVE